MLRSFWGGNSFGSGFTSMFWKVRRLRFGARIVGRIIDDLAQEPTRHRARELFKAYPKALKELPDSILRELGLPPFEKEYKRKHRGAMLSRKTLNWLTQETGVDFPSSATQGVPGIVEDAAEGSTGFLGRAAGLAKSIPLLGAGGTGKRLGLTRYRDRPIIKEEISRYRDIIRRKEEGEEEKKEKKKRGGVLRLPKKLQRSS